MSENTPETTPSGRNRGNRRSNGRPAAGATHEITLTAIPWDTSDGKTHSTVKFAENTSDDFLAVPAFNNLYMTKAFVATAHGKMPQGAKVTIEFF